MLLRLLAVAGLALSAYSLYVESAKSADGGFVAACDINAWISCSRVFASPYANGFGLVAPVLGEDHPLNLPNSVFGLAVYTVFLLFGGSTAMAGPLFLLAVACCTGSVYLGYILAVVLEDVCVVCISTYVVNAGLFIVTGNAFFGTGKDKKRLDRKTKAERKTK